jgi:hypothetical protein
MTPSEKQSIYDRIHFDVANPLIVHATNVASLPVYAFGSFGNE